MNGVFFFSIIVFFFTIHILFQSTYKHHDSYSTVIFFSIPELLIFMICLFLKDVSYFLNYIFSYFLVLNCIYFFFSYFEKKKKLYHFSFLFLILYLFVTYAISFHTKDFSFSSIISVCSFFLFFFFTLKKEKEDFSWKRIFYLLLLIIQTFFLYFLGKVYLCSPNLIGILCALPKCFVFSQLKKENNTFSYFLKDEFYHFFLISLFSFLTPISIFQLYDPYFLNCCHFGMFSHILLLFSFVQEKESYKLLFYFLFLLGFLIFFFRNV